MVVDRQRHGLSRAALCRERARRARQYWHSAERGADRGAACLAVAPVSLRGRTGSPPSRPRYHSRTGQYVRALLHRRGSVLVGLPRTALPDLDVVMETRALVPLLMNDAAALQI